MLAVLKMAAYFEFIIPLMTLLIALVIIIWKIATLVQFNWQLAFQTLGGFVLAVLKMAATCFSDILSCFEQFISIIWKIASFVFHITLKIVEMAATCVSPVFRCFEFVITQFIWKIASFVFIHSWHITVKIVETFVSLVGKSELISAVINSTMSSTVIVILSRKSVPFRNIYQRLAHKFQELARNAAKPEQRSSTVRGENARQDAAAMVQRNDRSPDVSLSTHSPTSADLIIRHRHPNSLDLEKEVEKELRTTKKLLDEERNSKLCAICFDNPRTVIIRPCMHYCLCEICQEQLWKCPICSGPIEGGEKIFYA